MIPLEVYQAARLETCGQISGNPFEQMFFQTLHWLITSAGLSTCAREEKKGASQHVPMSKTVDS